MRFLLMYVTDEMAIAALPASELDEIVVAKTKVGQELFAQGKHVIGGRLWPTATATRLSRTDGQLETVDGPFIETKEAVGGFDVIECASRAEALEWAKKYLGKRDTKGYVEVRPIWERCLCHGSYSCSSEL
jgi:hypothetical protein